MLLGVFLLPLDGMLAHRGVTPNIKFPSRRTGSRARPDRFALQILQFHARPLALLAKFNFRPLWEPVRRLFIRRFPFFRPGGEKH